MTLDVRTIVVLLVLSAVLMSITLAVGIRTGRGSGFVHWNVGLALFALGWLLMALRGVLPDFAGVALANASLVAGLCLQLAAMIRFEGRSVPPVLVYAPGPALFFLVLPLLDDYAVMTLAVSLAYASVLGATAWFAARLKSDAGPARWLLAATCSVAALMLLVRAGVLLVQPVDRSGLFSGGAVHVVAFLALFVLSSTSSVAFLLMLRERAEAEIRRLAMFDPLTALLNRRAFIELGEREIARASRLRVPYTVLMMDLDHFKRVNDRHGHQAGDRVLAAFAALAQRSVRAGDLVGRYGGEEFCAILPGASREVALAVAERLRASAAETPLEGLDRPITVSIGAATARPGDAPCSLDQALARADAALYRAKSEGRNRVASADAAALDDARRGKPVHFALIA
jgi:diguanylate cyclase (GGDEF)-like protein